MWKEKYATLPDNPWVQNCPVGFGQLLESNRVIIHIQGLI
jgi:hypothetical protein